MTSKSPIAPRQYTLEDIDVMRECIKFLEYACVEYQPDPFVRYQPSTSYTGVNVTWSSGSRFHQPLEERTAFIGCGAQDRTVVEEKLRTYMMGGVSRNELVIKKMVKEKELQKVVDRHNEKRESLKMRKELRRVFGLDE